MNQADKKKALKMFQYGMFIFTSKATKQFEGSPYAASTITWVSQASLEPPLVMVGLRADSWANAAVRQSKSFALNIIAKHQKAMAGKFFKNVVVERNTINGFEFECGVTGSPIFKDIPAYLECTVEDRVDKGDHSVLVGKVIHAKVRGIEEPILLRDTGWSYGG